VLVRGGVLGAVGCLRTSGLRGTGNVLGDEALRAGEGVPLGVEGWGEMSRQRHGVSRALLAVEGTKGNKSSPLQWG